MAPRILDWLPWNHVFGGSHNFNMMLANGGALYIDDGKPVKGLAERSLENMHLGFAERVMREADQVSKTVFWKPGKRDRQKFVRAGHAQDAEDDLALRDYEKIYSKGFSAVVWLDSRRVCRDVDGLVRDGSRAVHVRLMMLPSPTPRQR